MKREQILEQKIKKLEELVKLLESKPVDNMSAYRLPFEIQNKKSELAALSAQIEGEGEKKPTNEDIENASQEYCLTYHKERECYMAYIAGATDARDGNIYIAPQK